MRGQSVVRAIFEGVEAECGWFLILGLGECVGGIGSSSSS